MFICTCNSSCCYATFCSALFSHQIKQTNEQTTLTLIPNFMFIRTCNSSCCYAACCSCHTGWWEKSSSAPYVYDQPFFHTSWPGLAWVPTQCRADIDLLMLQLLIISWHLGFKCTLIQNPNKLDKLFGFFKKLKNWTLVSHQLAWPSLGSNTMQSRYWPFNVTIVDHLMTFGV